MKTTPLVYVLLGICMGAVLVKGYHRVVAHQIQAQVESKSINAHLAASRIEVPLQQAQANRMMVAITFGQAPSANEGESPKKANHNVFNFFKGKIYHAEDPLLGASGNGGSVWTRLGDQLIERQLYESVIFVPIGAAGSRITRWQPGGDLHERLMQVIGQVHESGLRITHLLWHQGASDTLHETSKEVYDDMFRAMLGSIRQEGITAPIYVAVSAAARCKKHHPSSSIREAQQELVDHANGIFRGPDSDVLGLEYRYDGCHFTDEGLEKLSNLWLDALTATEVALKE